MKQAFLGLIIVALARPGPLPAQEPPLEFGVSTALVTVPVFVTDKSGRPVTGLTAADFQIEEDGDSVRIVEFQAVDAAAPPAPGSDPATMGHARRQFLLLFDLSFSNVSGLVRAREAAKRFVTGQLEASDLAAVATYSARSGMTLLLTFTSDREQLAHTIDTLGLLDVNRKGDLLRLAFDFSGEASAAEQSDASSREAMLADELRDQQVAYQRSEEAVYTGQVENLLKAMTGLAEILDAVQGRKQVIYLSSGFDQGRLLGAQGEEARETSRAVTEGRLWEVDSELYFGSAGTRDRTRKLAEAFAASDAIVHTLDVSGLAASVDAQDGATTPRGRESLAQIANQGGGRFIRDTNDFNVGLGEILESSRHYYLVAYEARGSNSKPGRFHKIKVEVRGDGQRVSHRSGYSDPDPKQKPSAFARELAAADALVKGIEDRDIAFDVMALPYRGPSGRLGVPIVITVPGTSLTLGGADAIELDVIAYALDAEGRLVDHAAARMKLDQKRYADSLKARGLQVHTAFALLPGQHSLRLLVRDIGSGRRGILVHDMSVPELSDGELIVYPPMLMDDPDQWVVAPITSQHVERPELPFHVDGRVFVPLRPARFHAGDAQRLVVMSHGATEDELAAWELRAQLLDASGRPVALGEVGLVRQTHDVDDLQRVVLTVRPKEDLAAGDYSLRVRVRDRESGRSAESRTSIAN